MGEVVVLALFAAAESGHTIASVVEFQLVLPANSHRYLPGESCSVFIGLLQMLCSVNETILFPFVFTSLPDPEVGEILGLYSAVGVDLVDLDKFLASLVELLDFL